MFALNESTTFWVNVTNIALGAATVICLFVIGYAAVKDVVVRFKKTAAAREKEDGHIIHVPELGLTMTDGGEKLYDDDERAFG
jgi:hypothetical protein